MIKNFMPTFVYMHTVSPTQIPYLINCTFLKFQLIILYLAQMNFSEFSLQLTIT